MEDNEKTASEIARGIHPQGYGAIMSFTGTREFTARVKRPELPLHEGQGPQPRLRAPERGQRVHRGVLHDEQGRPQGQDPAA